MPFRLLLLLCGVAVSVSPAATWREDFADDPSSRGWRVFGETNLFRWDSTNQNLQVTWDSSRSNSYFFRFLGILLSCGDDFGMTFDLRVDVAGPGVETNKPFAFELALGFLNSKEATGTNFLRGTGIDSPDLVEFDYFPDTGFGATVWPVCVSSNSMFNYNGPADYKIFPLTPGEWYHVTMAFTASTQTLVTTLTNASQTDGFSLRTPMIAAFTDFRADTISVSSYSDRGAGDSILARGAVDNLVVIVPDPPVTNLAGAFLNGVWQVQFTARNDWLYTLESTEDLRTWTNASPATPGTDGTLTWSNNNAVVPRAFYRVKAEKP